MSNKSLEWEREVNTRIANVDNYPTTEKWHAEINGAGIQMMLHEADTEAAILNYKSLLGWYLPEEVQNATIQKFRQLRGAQVKG